MVDLSVMIPSIITGTVTLIAAQLVGYEWRAVVAACAVSLATSGIVALRLYYQHRKRMAMPILNRQLEELNNK